MATLENFSNLFKLSDDLLKKNFCIDQNLVLTLYITQESISFKTSFKSINNPQKILSSTYFQYKGPNLLLKQQISDSYSESEENPSSSKLKSTIEYFSDSRPNLKTKFELDSGAEYEKSTFSAEITNPNYKAKIAVSDEPAFYFATVFGRSDVGVGFNLVYDLASARFSQHDAAVWVDNGAWRGVFKHESLNSKMYSLGNLVASLYFKDFFECAAAVNAKFNFDSKSGSLMIGVEKRLGDYSVVKARVGLDGAVALAIRSRLNWLLQASWAMQCKPLEKNAAANFGVRVKVNQ